MIYSTDDSHFRIEANQLILQTPLDSDRRSILPIIIRANDNGQPSTSVCFHF